MSVCNDNIRGEAPSLPPCLPPSLPPSYDQSGGWLDLAVVCEGGGRRVEPVITTTERRGEAGAGLEVVVRLLARPGCGGRLQTGGWRLSCQLRPPSAQC